jgi:heme A synthase
MKVMINGKQFSSERIEALEQQELRFYNEIKSTAIVVIGYLVFVCIAGILHFAAGIPLDFGANHVINAFKTFR